MANRIYVPCYCVSKVSWSCGAGGGGANPLNTPGYNTLERCLHSLVDKTNYSLTFGAIKNNNKSLLRAEEGSVPQIKVLTFANKITIVLYCIVLYCSVVLCIVV